MEKEMKRIWQHFLVVLVMTMASRAFAAGLPRPLLLVLDKPENKLVMVDPAAKKIVGEVATGVGPHELTVSADGKLAYVANYGDQTPHDSSSVIELTARKELRRVNLGALRRPHGIAQSNGQIYFPAENNKLAVR